MEQHNYSISILKAKLLFTNLIKLLEQKKVKCYNIYRKIIIGGRNVKQDKKHFRRIYVKGLLRIIGEDLKQVILHGSYARGEQDQNGEINDIDIMILVDLNDEEIKEIEKK